MGITLEIEPTFSKFSKYCKTLNFTYSGLGCDCLRTAEYLTAMVTALDKYTDISCTRTTRTKIIVPYVSLLLGDLTYVPS